MAKRAKTDEPWIDNYPPLAEWLKQREAVCEHQLPIGKPERPEAFVEVWTVRRARVVIIVRACRRGWDIYTQGDSNRIDVTLADADLRIEKASR